MYHQGIILDTVIILQNELPHYCVDGTHQMIIDAKSFGRVR